MIIFDDVKRKYLQASEVIDEYMEIVNRDNPLDTSIYAPWINLPVLAAWSYEGSKEFLNNFRSDIKKFTEATRTTHPIINDWDSVLSSKVSSFRDNLLMVFGTENRRLTEALSP